MPAAVIALGAAGCGKTVLQSHEGQYCSTDDDEDPQYECSRDRDLVCIHTYNQQIYNPDGGVQKMVPIYLCRDACNPGDRCPNAEDVCCPGRIVGIDYNRSRACVPLRFCEMPPPIPDAAPRDTSRETAQPDGPAGDAGALDAAPDAPESIDAGADAGADADAGPPT
jgi:hypothetical protein